MGGWGPVLATVSNFVLLATALVGILLTRRQLADSAKTNKASFFKDLYTTMYSDTDVSEAFYEIEYGSFAFDDKAPQARRQRTLDRLLSIVNLTCDLHAQGILSEHEMSFFKYRFVRIYTNEDIKRYLGFVSRSHEAAGVGERAFPSFVEYCETVLARLPAGGVVATPTRSHDLTEGVPLPRIDRPVMVTSLEAEATAGER